MTRWLSWRHRGSRGFTLIEVLIVIVVISILAAILFMRIFSARQRANETNARGNLKELRRAVKVFENDMGAYPQRLADVCTKTAPDQGLLASGTTVKVVTFSDDDKKDFKGPYYEYPAFSLPPNALTGGNEEGVDWIYLTDSPTTLGRVQNGAPGRDQTGVFYSEW